MNRQIIESNIKEAREQLEEIEKRLSANLLEGELLVMLQHAYHHLNFAWNVREVPTKRYASMTDEEFNEWGKIPQDMDDSIFCLETGEKEEITDEVENLLEAIRQRFTNLGPQKCRRESFLAHLRSLGRWEADVGNYPDPGEVTFPEKIHISYAVCNQDCGVREFIVDGSTQECQKCGDLMFRTDVAEYQFLKKEQD
ncbi:MAG: hypothetical protein PHI97_24960 [Desulfobulbus sp.]|nr:hypothetical protein [Desulfobulbus sp.]